MYVLTLRKEYITQLNKYLDNKIAAPKNIVYELNFICDLTLV